MPYDVNHPACITKILTYACTRAHEPFHHYARVHPDWYDAIEPNAASAVILKLNITRTPDRWMQNNTSLEQFNATPLYSVKEIGSNFMANSMKLQRVDFSGNTFESVEIINDFFCFRCLNLRHVDFSSLKNVIGIARGFCSNTSIESIDLSFAANVNEVLAEFLSSTKLKTIDVSPLHKLDYLPDSFLSNNTQLTEIKGLSHFNSITEIDYGLFLNCSSLRSLDVSFLRNLRKVPHSFLKNCSSLEELIGLDQLTKVTVIEANFLSGCKNLKGKIDFTGLAESCHTVHVDGFLSGCTGLSEINLVRFGGKVTNFGPARTPELKFEGVIRPFDKEKDKNTDEQDEKLNRKKNEHYAAVACGNLTNLVLPEEFRSISSTLVQDFMKKVVVIDEEEKKADDDEENTAAASSSTNTSEGCLKQ